MSPFKSYIMGGFECADHINRSGDRVNLLKVTEHDKRVEEDYELLIKMGIYTVREGICWSEVEKSDGTFNFDEVRNRMMAADKFGIQQIWDLIHFGYPDGLYPTHPKFCDRFIALCKSFASFYLKNSKQRLFVVPINEISFLSWHSGDVRGTVPFMINSGFDIKYHLCKAAILGIGALKAINPDCRIVLIEPLVRIHGTENIEAEQLAEVNEHQFQAMDIIAGRMCPELNGREEFLDILGFNYYWNCQWEMNGETLPWPDVLNKRMQLRDMLSAAYLRYRKPLFLGETGHIGCGRAEWLEEIFVECTHVKKFGIPFLGLCIYPVIDRPNWDDLEEYHNSGIFDLDNNLNRIPESTVVDIIVKEQQQTHIISFN